jgi:hypothetical protein
LEPADGVTNAPVGQPGNIQEASVPAAVLNVPPAEAARRREAATKLLRDGGVPPETLSPEQFNIFANQSPDLQKESLAMLQTYGAERLRVVHPEREASATPQPQQTPTHSTPALPPPQQTTAMTIDTSTPQATPKSRKIPNNKQKATTLPDAAMIDGNTPFTASDGQQAVAGAGRQRRQRIRRSCVKCKERKVKVRVVSIPAACHAAKLTHHSVATNSRVVWNARMVVTFANTHQPK